MPLLDRIERLFGRFTLPNLLPILLMGQVLVYLFLATGAVTQGQLLLNAGMMLQGQVWRAVTFMLLPLSDSPIWFALGVYITWLMGSALQKEWGEVRFALYVSTGWFLTVLSSFIFPGAVFGNQFVMGLFTLGFAKLYPNFEFLMFFIIPMKVKYIGWITWGMYAMAFLGGSGPVRAMVLSASAAWLLFFGGELARTVESKKRKAAFTREAKANAQIPMHTCEKCGKNNLTHPQTDFRYQGGRCFCESFISKGSCDDA